MHRDIKTEVSQLLEHIVELLDIPETHNNVAEERYKAVGKWIGDEDSQLALFRPEIYPQGSFRLGTVIRHINEADEYDIDLVCELTISKDNVTQKQLKQMVGDRLKENDTYARMLDPKEGRRCWTLNYADSAKFHMDILPAIPEDSFLKLQLQKNNVSGKWAGQAISITDTTHPNYDQLDVDWPRSNPKGYAEWFRERMKIQYDERRRIIAEKMRAGIEDVPEYQIKTPLQRVVQILKRHRDIMFEKDSDHKPISIIITTLAAHAYNNETDLFEALTNIITGMPNYIVMENGVSLIANPVDPEENFADKWREHPEREAKFRNWLQRLHVDLNIALHKGEDIKAIGESLKIILGEGVINNAFTRSKLPLASTIAVPNVSYPKVEIKNPSKPWGNNDR